jgi:DNA-binding beta-propeller fold protein YncE
MRTRLLLVFGALAGLVMSGGTRQETVQAGALIPLLESPLPSDICLMPSDTASFQQTRGGGAGGRMTDKDVRPTTIDWPHERSMVLDAMPLRTVFDPFPTFGGLAVDPAAGRAFFSDSSLSGLLSYDTAAGGTGPGITDPATHIFGPETGIGFIAGVAVDPGHKEIYAVNNDGGGIVIFAYDQNGSVRMVRGLESPMQSWGISFSKARDEIAVSVQQLSGVVVYRRGAEQMDPPLRSLRGEDTGLADPHGIAFDDERKELVVANHGNWTELRPYSPYDPLTKTKKEYNPGRFEPPSIRVYPATAQGNVKPLRTIQGDRTGLNWPMGVEIDAARNELVVANYGDNSVLFFDRAANGDAGPMRLLKGDRTGIVGPIDVDIDPVRNEIWVANYSDHTALVFDRAASGNVAPKRIIRNAPAGSPALTFTNAAAAAYDTKRDALIVPN